MKNKSLALALALLMLFLLVPSGVFAVDYAYQETTASGLIVKSNVNLGDSSNYSNQGTVLSFKGSGTYEISMAPGVSFADCDLGVKSHTNTNMADITLILNNGGAQSQQRLHSQWNQRRAS